METSKLLLYIALAACILALIKPVSASTLDQLFNYSLIGVLQEKMDVERLNIIDLDNNELPEILVITTGKGGSPNTALKNTAYMFDRNGSIRWRYGMDREILASFIKDVNNDLKPEVVVSSGLKSENIPRGTIRVIDSEGDVVKQYSRTSLIISMQVDDMDSNMYYQLLAGSEGKASLYNIDGERLWDYPDQGLLNESVYSISAIDLEDDGHKEVMYGSTGVVLLDGQGRLITSYELDTELDPHNRKVSYVAPVRLSSREQKQILAATSSQNRIYAIEIKNIMPFPDEKGHNRYTAILNATWTYTFYDKINAIKTYDLDNDNFDEILVVNDDGNIYALDNNGATMWSFKLDGPAKDFAITDIESDGELDLVVASYSGSIYDLDKRGNFKWKDDTNLRLEKIAVGDIDSDSLNEIAVTTSAPELCVYKLNMSFVQKAKADNLYTQGERLFISSSYLESRDYLVRAKDIYSLLGLESDVNRAESLISRIDAKLSEDRRGLADVYYEKAQNFYISGDYSSSERYVGMAKSIYAEFGDSENVLKCELLELRIKTVTGATTPTTPTTVPIRTTTTTTPTSSGLNFSQVLLYGVIVVAALIVLAYVKKRSSEKGNQGRTISGEVEGIPKLDELDLNLDEDEK